MRTIFILICFLYSLNAFSQDKKLSFKLVSGSKIKTIKRSNFLHLEHVDNSELIGDFLFLQDNKIYIKPVTWHGPNKGQFKIYNDTASPVAIDISSLNRIIKDRTTLTSILGAVFWASAITALVVSPIASIKKDKPFNWNRCLTISGISGATAVLSIGVFLVFDERSFYLKSNGKNKRLWNIQP